MDPALALVGFSMKPITLAWGTSSESRSRRFGSSSNDIMLTPVRLPPGRATLAIKPAATSSSPGPIETTGIAEVALFASCIPGRPAAVFKLPTSSNVVGCRRRLMTGPSIWRLAETMAQQSYFRYAGRMAANHPTRPISDAAVGVGFGHEERFPPQRLAAAKGQEG